MFKSFKYRIYPTESQIVLINKHIGASRFIYNLALEAKRMAYSGNKYTYSCFELINQLAELKKECPWLKELNAQSLQTPIINLNNSFNNFFKKQSEFPNFKKKSNAGSFNVPQHSYFKKEKLSIPKFREGIEINLHRPFEGAIKQTTISKTPTGKFFASILCETGELIPEKSEVKESTSVGIDLGLKTFLVTSEGKEYGNPKFLRKAQSKLGYVNRKYSKNKGKRTRIKLAKIHEKVVNKRKDFLQKTSTEIIKNHDSICIEDLNILGMLQNKNVALSISDAGWHMFTEMLRYKAEWHGKNIVKIGMFEPSSRMCNCCGILNKELKLSEREWTCKSCGETHDRDINAAINIKNFALKNILSGTDRKIQNELPTLVGVMTSETNNR